MLTAAMTLAFLLILLGAVLWAGSGKTIHEPEGSGIVEAIPDALETEPLPSDELVVLSYSIAYGLGVPPSAGPPGDAIALYDRLDQIIETIAASGADVVLLQEVDFASRRSYDVDQLQYIAAALGWGFVARVITWECRYLPMPFWPPWRQTGRLRAGQGIISRYSLVQNRRQRLSQPPAQPLLAPLFAPYCTVQMVDVQCSGRTIRVLNVHLEPHDVATRQRQAEELVRFVRQVATPNCVLMGAFQSVVEDVSATQGAPDVTPDHTMEMITTGLRDRLRIVADTTPTYPAGAPRDRRDHALVGPGLQTVDTHVVTLDEPVSDHLPLLVRLRWALPRVQHHGSNTNEHL